MKLVILYKPNSEHARSVETFLHDFQPHIPAGIKTEILDINTRNGAAMGMLYDIMEYPGILVTTDDGVMIQSWSGKTLPLMDDVASYLHG